MRNTPQQFEEQRFADVLVCIATGLSVAETRDLVGTGFAPGIVLAEALAQGIEREDIDASWTEV